MGGKSQKTKVEPWKEAQPLILGAADRVQELFEAGQLAPDNVGLGDVTKEGLRGLGALGRNNPITQMATGGLGDYLGAPRFAREGGFKSALPDGSNSPNFIATQGPSAINVGNVQGPGSFDVASRLPDAPQSYGRVDPNAGIGAVRENIMATALNPIQTMFGTGGFSKSTAAQSAAGRAVTNALAPYEYAQLNRVDDVNRDQFNQEQQRALNYGLASTGLEANQFNTDQNRRLGFDVNERDTRLNQANVNDARRVAFGDSQNAQRLAQQNTNADRVNALALAGDDRRRDQYNTQQNRAFDQYATQRQQQLAGLGLAPSINQLQYGDVNALLTNGQIRDRNRAANVAENSDEALRALQAFSNLGGLGGTTWEPTDRSAGGDILGGLTGGLGAYGTLAANPATAPFALGGAVLTGLGSLF